MNKYIKSAIPFITFLITLFVFNCFYNIDFISGVLVITAMGIFGVASAFTGSLEVNISKE